MKKKTLAIVLVLLALLIAYAIGINAYFRNSGRGQATGSGYYDQIRVNYQSVGGKTTHLTIRHEAPLVFLNGFDLVVRDVDSQGKDRVYYKGHYNREIEIPRLADQGSALSFDLYKNGYRYPFSSDAGYDPKKEHMHVTLFLNYKEQYLGWYKID